MAYASRPDRAGTGTSVQMTAIRRFLSGPLVIGASGYRRAGAPKAPDLTLVRDILDIFVLGCWVCSAGISCSSALPREARSSILRSELTRRMLISRKNKIGNTD
jgi:hypothetical protein